MVLDFGWLDTNDKMNMNILLDWLQQQGKSYEPDCPTDWVSDEVRALVQAVTIPQLLPHLKSVESIILTTAFILFSD